MIFRIIDHLDNLIMQDISVSLYYLQYGRPYCIVYTNSSRRLVKRLDGNIRIIQQFKIN
jgi:hypothetical protein